MSRGSTSARQALAVLLVAVLSLLSGYVAFQFVTRHGSPSTPSAGAAGGSGAAAPDASATGPAPARGASPAPGASPGVRVLANGTPLFAEKPLSDVHQDQGSSVPLPDGRTLWIFADTFQVSRTPSFFITSSAGVSAPGSWELQYSMGNTSGGVRYPAEFMPRTQAEKADHQGRNWYQAVWPTGSTQLPDGRIIISYAKYRVFPKTPEFTFMGSGLYSFTYRGYKKFRSGDVAKRIADDIWTIYDGEVRSPVYANGFIYFTQCKDLRCYSLRTSPAGMTTKASYTWWTGDGWSTNAGLKQQVSVATNHPGGNPSIVRLKNGLYAMADTEAGVPARTAQFWVAPAPWGPWSAAASFTLPNCPPSGCYGLNLHPEASTGKNMRLSYSAGGSKPIVVVSDIPFRIDPGGGWITVP